MSKVEIAKEKPTKTRKTFLAKEPSIPMQKENEAKAKSKTNTEVIDNPDFEPALKELFVSSIKDIYWAENHLVKALPKMIKAATAEPLKKAITKHLEETKTHVERLENIFQLLGKAPQAKKYDAMEGLTIEGEEIIEETKIGTGTRDVGIILSSQKVEHYEIATYGGLVKLASIIGEDEIANILKQTLEEEKLADQKLSNVAESEVNYKASEE